jgi:hypothetical protein
MLLPHIVILVWLNLVKITLDFNHTSKNTHEQNMYPYIRIKFVKFISSNRAPTIPVVIYSDSLLQAKITILQ